MTVEIVPFGREASAEVIEQIEISQVRNLEPDDPGGLRQYLIKRQGVRWSDVSSSDIGEVRHHRRDGASALAAEALSKMPNTWTGP